MRRGLRVAAVLACAGAAPSCSSEPELRHHRLDIRELMFQPQDLEVAPGDTVSWINHDIVPHTVTAADARWDSGEVISGGEFTLIAGGADTVSYLCRYHPTMTGSLAIR